MSPARWWSQMRRRTDRDGIGAADAGAGGGTRRFAGWLRVRTLLVKELRQLFRDPKTKGIIFVAPVLQLLLLGYAVTTDVRHVPTFIVDHDVTSASRELRDALTGGDYFRIVGSSPSSEDLTAAMDAGRAVLGVHIPAGYARDLAAGRGASVQLIIDGSNSNTGTVAQGYATRIIHQVAVEHAAARGATLAGGIELRARAWYNPELVSRTYNVPAVMGIVLLLMSLLLTALSVVREREIGTLEQLLVSPISAGELILGKMLPVTMIAFIDLAIVVGVGMLWFGIPLQGSPLLLLFGATLYILAGLGMGLLLSTISRTQQEAFMAMFLLLFPMIVLAGLMYPIHTMPAFFQDLTLLNPARHFLKLVRAVFLKGAGAADLWPELLALALTAAAMLGLATWRFRQQMR